MRTRLAPLAATALLGAAGFAMLSLTHGQDAGEPVVAPAPKRLPVAPARLTAPPPADAAPFKPSRDLSRLKPLTRQLYLAAVRGSGWLDRMNEKKGRFVHGWLPALNTPLEGDHALRQAGAAFALARAARFLQEDGHAARAAQAVLALLEDTVLSQDKKCRMPVLPSTIVNRVAATSLLILAMNELPNTDASLLMLSEQLCEFLRRQQQADGSFLLCEPIAGGTAVKLDSERTAEYPGMALCALMRSYEKKPADWKLAAVRKAMPFYMKWWRDHKHCEFVLWHSAAYAEAFLASKDKAFAEAVLEMNDWVCSLQHERLDPTHPQWMGGFQNVADGKTVSSPPDVSSAVCAGALAEACRVTRQMGDLARHERYTAAVERGLQFLAALQYTESDTQHFAEWYRNDRLVGGFHASHTDGNLRLDYNQHAVSALVQYLRYVAQVPF